jgi:acyl transferase domain-containing protein
VLTGAEGAAPPSGRADAAQGRPVAFLFAGVGEQYPGMVGELYRREPVFARFLDECLAVLGELIPGVDLLDLLAGERGGGPDLASLLGRAAPGGTDARAAMLERTDLVQPLMFAAEYALARTLMAWGLRPKAMLGYSLGEYVAACLAGVLSLPDALALVTHRAKLIAAMPAGSMLAVAVSASDLQRRFRLAARGLGLAVVNGPQMAVVAGPPDAVAQLADDLRAAGRQCRPLQTTHAFHSPMLAPLSGELTAWVAANVRLSAPRLPYFSNVTGELADAALVTDPGYWARHMCETVQFAAGTAALLADPALALVEIGPGPSLGAITRSAGCPPERWPLVLATMPAATDLRPADLALADCLARLWLVGAEPDWAAYHGRHPDASAAAGPDPAAHLPVPAAALLDRAGTGRRPAARQRAAGRADRTGRPRPHPPAARGGVAQPAGMEADRPSGGDR